MVKNKKTGKYVWNRIPESKPPATSTENEKHMLVTNTGQTRNEDSKCLDIHHRFVSKPEANVFLFLHELSQLRFGLSVCAVRAVRHLVGTLERVLRNFAFRHYTCCALAGIDFVLTAFQGSLATAILYCTSGSLPLCPN